MANKYLIQTAEFVGGPYTLHSEMKEFFIAQDRVATLLAKGAVEVRLLSILETKTNEPAISDPYLQRVGWPTEAARSNIIRSAELSAELAPYQGDTWVG